MNKNRDLLFLRLLVEKMPSQTLTVNVCGHKYFLSSELGFLTVVRDIKRNSIETDDRRELYYFFRDNSAYLVSNTEDDLYLMLIQDALKAVLKEGKSSREDMRALIGSIVEHEPKENEAYLRLLKGIEKSMGTERCPFLLE